MPFFLQDKKSKNKTKSKAKDKSKRKFGKEQNTVKNKKRKLQDEEIITSESEAGSDDERTKKDEDVESVDSSDDETVDEKRNRLAKKMLDEIKDKFSQEDEVSTYLKNQLLERSGKLHKDVADLYIKPTKDDMTFCRWTKLSVVTCVVISPDNRYIFSGSKDGCIVKWQVDSGQKVHIIYGSWKGSNPDSHSDEILSLAISSDGKFLVSGSKDTFIKVWDPNTCKHVHTFRGHKNSVTGLCFRKGSHQLFSSSQDKSIKLWNLDENAYVETLFGHEDSVTSIDCLAQERAVSSGGRDGSVRVWKIIDESHLVFHGHTSCIDCVRFIDDRHFFSASDDNSLALWSTERKKPVVTVKNAHGNKLVNGNETVNGNSEAVNGNSAGPLPENWITAIAALHNTDLVVSGSRDGKLRFWKIGEAFRSLEPHFSTGIEGFVNAIEFSEDGKLLVLGIGREHRMGRWFKPIKTVKNSICIIRLKRTDTK